MAEEQNNERDEDGTGDTTGTSPGNDDSEVYTKEELNRHLAGMRRKYESQIEEMKSKLDESPKPKKQPKKKQTDDGSDLRSEFEDLRRELAFERSASEFDLTPKQRGTLLKLAKLEQPEDMGQWLSSQVADLFGGAKKETEIETKNEEPETPGKPKSDKGPAAEPSWDKKLSALDWTREDINKIREEKGAIAARRYIREQFERSLKGLKLSPKR